MKQTVLAIPVLFVFAWLFGVAIFWLVAATFGYASGGYHAANGRFTAGFLFITLFAAGLFFCIPGVLTSLCAATLLRWPRFQSPRAFCLMTCAISIVVFYLYLSLQGIYVARRVHSVAALSLLPREPLALYALVIAPLAFGPAAFVTSGILRRAFRPTPRHI